MLGNNYMAAKKQTSL